ncbi:MAG TPA: prepilin-type N-terminal cleavage/methylation domain-containing protein [Verrucomicrobiae bacterium]|nr:prepilin-type N-terminal cleavage/methylation domain-containing protein [Verrucomicrobiae bacterium]
MHTSTLKKPCDGGFTFVELLVVLAVLAILSVMLLPAIAGTKPNSQSFQCMDNQRQLILGWQMYAQDNRELLPPNDYPYTTPYRLSANKHALYNWVCGTMEQAYDAGFSPELTDPVGTAMTPYITNAAVYHCPADNYVDVFINTLHVRSYSMNSAVGTIWSSSSTYGGTAGVLGSPVGGGFLPGQSYNANQTAWLTYGKMTSFTHPGPANTFVFMDESPLSINDGALLISASAAPGATYLIDYPGGNHNGATPIAFVDGHVIIHKWQDPRTYSPPISVHGGGGGGTTFQSPDDIDCFFLAPITSAAR